MCYTDERGKAPRLLLADTKALNHILMNAYDYPKPDINRVGLGRILGPGILVVEGNQHKLQVRRNE